MSRIRLRLRRQPGLRVDLRGLKPLALSGLTLAEIEHVEFTEGRQRLPLAELFDIAVESSTEAELCFEGDLRRCDRIGWQLDGGLIAVDGDVGDLAGCGMSAGVLRVAGSAGLQTGCEMAGGLLSVAGNVGDHAAGTLPGSMDGMRGGSLIVGGRAGARLGDRMRRGTLLVFGDVGDFAASRMVAGTIAIGGRTGAHLAYGMRRGSVVLAGPEPAPPPPTFVQAVGPTEVFWQLLARDLARHGGPFADLPGRQARRHLGDLSAAGHGELIYA